MDYGSPGIGMRMLLAALALFPLLAPYELLIRTEWEHFANPFVALAAAIAAGATALSAFLLFAALAGLSSRMVFDRRTRTVKHSAQSAFLRPTEHMVRGRTVAARRFHSFFAGNANALADPR